MDLYSTDEYLRIADCLVQFIDDNFDSSFMWTAHNEIETKWDYVKAYDLGWFTGLDKKYGKPAAPKRQSKPSFIF